MLFILSLHHHFDCIFLCKVQLCWEGHKNWKKISQYLFRVREKINIFSQFLKAFSEYICINFKVQIFWESHKDLAKPYILHLLSKRNLNITPLQLHSCCNKRCTTDNFPSTGRNSFFILPINLNCHIAQKSQILPQKTNIVLRKLWTWMVAKMFYVLLHTLNSFLSALSIGEMAFGFEFELHAYSVSHNFIYPYLFTGN